MEIRLNEVSITSYAVRGESGSELPQESFTISYGKIRYYYYVGTTVDAGWDLVKNKEILFFSILSFKPKQHCYGQLVSGPRAWLQNTQGIDLGICTRGT